MDENVIYKPCKKCQSISYDNCDFETVDENENGDFIINPKSCDKCDFLLMLSPSKEIH